MKYLIGNVVEYKTKSKTGVAEGTIVGYNAESDIYTLLSPLGEAYAQGKGAFKSSVQEDEIIRVIDEGFADYDAEVDGVETVTSDIKSFKELLPIGSIVRLKGQGDTLFIINNYYPSLGNRTADYMAVVYDNGYVSDDYTTFLFMHKNIQEILHRGYANDLAFRQTNLTDCLKYSSPFFYKMRFPGFHYSSMSSEELDYVRKGTFPMDAEDAKDVASKKKKLAIIMFIAILVIVGLPLTLINPIIGPIVLVLDAIFAIRYARRLNPGKKVPYHKTLDKAIEAGTVDKLFSKENLDHGKDVELGYFKLAADSEGNTIAVEVNV